jgi:plastocyanin
MAGSIAIQCTLITFEHELTHLLINVFCPDVKRKTQRSLKAPTGLKTVRNVHGPEFKRIVHNWYGHRATTHQLKLKAGFLSSANQRAASQDARRASQARAHAARATLSLKPGDTVEFTGAGKLHGQHFTVVRVLPKNILVQDLVSAPPKKFKINPTVLRITGRSSASSPPPLTK